jgi:hypothetical protein
MPHPDPIALAGVSRLHRSLSHTGHSSPHLVLVASYADARRPVTCAARYNLPMGQWVAREFRHHIHGGAGRQNPTCHRVVRNARAGLSTIADWKWVHGDRPRHVRGHLVRGV